MCCPSWVVVVVPVRGHGVVEVVHGRGDSDAHCNEADDMGTLRLTRGGGRRRWTHTIVQGYVQMRF